MIAVGISLAAIAWCVLATSHLMSAYLSSGIGAVQALHPLVAALIGTLACIVLGFISLVTVGYVSGLKVEDFTDG